MNSQQLLYFNVVVGALFLLYFLWGKSSTKRPTRLNLKNKDTPLDPALKPTNAEKSGPQNQLNPRVTVLEPETSSADFGNSSSTGKNLAIFFVYNGHDWEAHHVLGVPQGANIKTVTDAYQKMLLTSDAKSYDFLEAAYKVILHGKRRDSL